jgi:hypothetical protein
MQVASEETVLYTAQAYGDSLATQTAVDKLAPLVRCPHLPHFWLSASILSSDADKLLLQRMQPQLKQLMLLKAGRSPSADLSEEDIKKGVPDAPASWLLPVRDIQPVSSMKLEWEVDVAAIRHAAQDSANKKRTTLQWSPTSCLLGGVRWSMQLKYNWDASKQGIMIGLYSRARNLPAGSLPCCTFSLRCVGVDAGGHVTHSKRLFSDTSGWGYENVFELGSMPGGFDEAAWAAKGLPASSSITLRLTVQDVGV